VQSGNVEPEKARTWELGTRYDDGALTAEMGLFLINFNNQYDSNQTNDTVTARGKTRHTGLETQARYDLGTLTPTPTGPWVNSIPSFLRTATSLRS
jgi:Fe(3+) dicitrate transport protein